VQRLHEGQALRSLFDRKMRVQDLGAFGNEPGEIAARVLENAWRDLHDLCSFSDLRARLGEKRHAMPERREPANQRDDDALWSAVSFDREPVMGRDYDVHRSPIITKFGDVIHHHR